ncbi:AbrB/MazE/SpoVT family DNA-binding domain-containing protein [Candidatus Fermentibacteria bacterium]|nr:AbrB/MazE/SpoVT family DNA-binding domain-containing protein [Candidatus Fermentibacteria bacterium]
MPTSTITSKGQTTIPKEVRDFLGVHPGDQVDFVIQDGGVLVKPATVDARTLRGALRRYGETSVPVEAMTRAVRERFAGERP